MTVSPIDPDPSLPIAPADFAPRLSAMTAVVRNRTPLVPEIGIVLGSGLGRLADAVDDPVAIQFRELPGMPAATAPGHDGSLMLGFLGGRPVLVQLGRYHLYEGVHPGLIGLQIALHYALGARALLVTNAAGGLNPEYEPGALMAITDHINMTGRSPLTGPNDIQIGPRCPDMTNAWSPRLRRLLRAAAITLGDTLEEGIYAGWPGPAFETPAEVRMLRLLGADAVGMSTVLEAVAARWIGLELCGISLITNAGAGYSTTPLTHEQHMRAAVGAAPRLVATIEQFVRDYTAA